MSRFVRWCFLLAITGGLLGTQFAMAQDGVNGNLVTVKWLEKNLKNPDILLLDASGPQTYAKNHIPGAVSVSMMVVNYPFALVNVPDAQLEKMYQATGISVGKKIVMYDQGGDNDAPRLFFSLYYHGLPAKDMFIVDGGLSKWQAEGLPVTKDPTPATPNPSFKMPKPLEDARASLPEVITATGDPTHNAVVNALDASWHYGVITPMAKAGHIPNSALLPRDDFYNADKTFKSPDEIRAMLAFEGVRPDQQVITYCGGGIAAAVPYFAARFIANYPNVKLFPGSVVEWLADERELPFWTYDTPSLMRDSNWLKFWDSQMLRMFVGTNVSVVDVRPPDAYGQGHVPFALNVPADVFRNNVKDPTKLASTLGSAGVHASDEAVILSGAGLTKDAALAFVMLEKVGQKKVSVLMDPADKWSQPGFAVTKDPTAVGPKKGPMDVSIVPAAYPANVRKDVVIADPNSTRSTYPKVYIASGKEAPAKAPEGKVVHVAYTDLLNADGTPKAAKDIWTVLSKAGVPRYAELVCFSDDPGEAATNYYILKLMGYRDIKVLVM